MKVPPAFGSILKLRSLHRPYTTLSELTNHIKWVMDGAFAYQSYWVLAEVTDHKFYPGNGTHYFCLVDKDPFTHALSAKMNAVAWRDGGSKAIAHFQQATGQSFTSDIQVLLLVSVAYHKRYGLQLILQDIDVAFTTGQLEQKRRDVLDQLMRECPESVKQVNGRFQTTNNQLALRRVVQKVAVITSANAAGYIDFMDALATNNQGYRIHVTPYFTQVQGEANAAGFCLQLQKIQSSKVAYDAVVVIRGGGAQTDFLLFNQFSVARAVATFPIPVIAGIGHQINETIVDLMAHTSVKTPSVAAEIIIEHNRHFEHEMRYMQQQLVIKSQQMLHQEQQALSAQQHILAQRAKDLLVTSKQELAAAVHHFAVRSKTKLHQSQSALETVSRQLADRSLAAVSGQATQLSRTGDRLGASSLKYLSFANRQLNQYHLIMQLMDPVNLQKRGFALLYQSGRLITNTSDLNQQAAIQISLNEASIEATIQSITQEVQ